MLSTAHDRTLWGEGYAMNVSVINAICYIHVKLC